LSYTRLRRRKYDRAYLPCFSYTI